MRTSCVILTALVLLGGCVAYQEVDISIYDAETNRPLPEANVVVQRAAAFAKLNARSHEGAKNWYGQTNVDGVVRLTFRKDDMNWLHVDRIGYREHSLAVNPDDFRDGTFRVDIIRD